MVFSNTVAISGSKYRGKMPSAGTVMVFCCTLCQSKYLRKKSSLPGLKAYRNSLVLLAYVSTWWDACCDITVLLPKELAVLLKWYCITLCHGIFPNNKSNIILIVFSWISVWSMGYSLTCRSGAWLVTQAPLLHWFKPDCIYLQFNEELA